MTDIMMGTPQFEDKPRQGAPRTALPQTYSGIADVTSNNSAGLASALSAFGCQDWPIQASGSEDRLNDYAEYAGDGAWG
jgi:hypothetical protein